MRCGEKNLKIIEWDLVDRYNKSIQIIRSSSNHIIFVNERPAVYSMNFGFLLWFLTEFNEKFIEGIVQCLKIWLKLPIKLRPKKRIEIEKFDDKPAMENQVAKYFLQNEFEKEGDKLVFWPSGI